MGGLFLTLFLIEMKKIALIIALALPLAMWAQDNTAQQKTYKPSAKLKTLQDSVSYAMGIDAFHALSQNVGEFGINWEVFKKGIEDASKDKPGYTTEQMQQVFQKYQNEMQRIYNEKLEKTLAEGRKFLEENKKSKSVIVTESGLQYKVLKEGTGKKPEAGGTVTCHYTGTLIDGTKFDSSYDRNQPLTIGLNQVIKGWGEGLQLMKEGSKYMFYIPNELAYGQQQAGMIPPGAAIIFEVELIKVEDTQK